MQKAVLLLLCIVGVAIGFGVTCPVRKPHRCSVRTQPQFGKCVAKAADCVCPFNNWMLCPGSPSRPSNCRSSLTQCPCPGTGVSIQTRCTDGRCVTNPLDCRCPSGKIMCQVSFFSFRPRPMLLSPQGFTTRDGCKASASECPQCNAGQVSCPDGRCDAPTNCRCPANRHIACPGMTPTQDDSTFGCVASVATCANLCREPGQVKCTQHTPQRCDFDRTLLLQSSLTAVLTDHGPPLCRSPASTAGNCPCPNTAPYLCPGGTAPTDCKVRRARCTSSHLFHRAGLQTQLRLCYECPAGQVKCADNRCASSARDCACPAGQVLCSGMWPPSGCKANAGACPTTCLAGYAKCFDGSCKPPWKCACTARRALVAWPGRLAICSYSRRRRCCRPRRVACQMPRKGGKRYVQTTSARL
jgi:hypothetical protein